MLKFTVATLLTMIGSPEGYGAVYQMPTDDPELREVATFPLEVFESDLQRKTLRYALPRMLTGSSVVIEMQRTNDEESPRIYEGPNVEGRCTGPLDRPRCEVKFKSLQLGSIDQQAAEREIKRRHLDPKLRAATLSLQSEFMTDEPIGLIDAQVEDRPPIALDTWYDAHYTVPHTERVIPHKLCFTKEASGKVIGHYRVGEQRSCFVSACNDFCPSSCSLCGSMDRMHVFGSFVSGRWQVGRQDGWVELTFRKNGRFSGRYGMQYAPSSDVPVAGRWWGREN